MSTDVAVRRDDHSRAVVELPDLSTFERYRSRLVITRSDDELLPMDTLERIGDELITALYQPTPEPFAVQCALSLAACYPNGKPDEGWLSILIEEMQEFEPSVVRETVVRLRRSQKFLPSVAEVYQALEETRRQWRIANDVVLWQMERHAAIEARQIAERQEQERIERWNAECRETFGGALTWAAIIPLSVAVSEITNGSAPLTLRWALEKQEPWAFEALRRFRLMQRAMEARPLPDGWGLLVRIAWSFYEARDDDAVALVEAAERGEYTDPQDQSFASRSSQENAKTQIGWALEERSCTEEHRQAMQKARQEAAERGADDDPVF